MNRKRVGILLFGTMLTVSVLIGCGRVDDVETQKDGTDIEQTNDDTPSDADSVETDETVTLSVTSGSVVYEVLDHHTLVCRDEEGNRIRLVESDRTIVDLQCNDRKCYYLTDTDEKGEYMLYSVWNGTTDIVEELSLPVTAFQVCKDGMIFAQDISGRCYYYDMESFASTIQIGDMPETVWTSGKQIRPIRDGESGYAYDIITAPNAAQREAYLAFCDTIQIYEKAENTDWSICSDGTISNRSGEMEVNAVHAMPQTLCETGDVVFYADCNEIHRMNRDGTDNRVIFAASDVIYEMQGTAEYLFYSTTNATWRLHVPSGICDRVAEHYNRPVSLQVINNRDVRICLLKDLGNQVEWWETFCCARGILNAGEIASEVRCSYSYGDHTYVLWGGSDGCMMIGKQDSTGGIEVLTSGESLTWMITVEEEREPGRFSWDTYQYEMDGDDTYCYLKTPCGAVYYVDYEGREIRPLLLEIDAVTMKVCDKNHFLLRRRMDRISYMTYDPVENTMLESLHVPDNLQGIFPKPSCIPREDDSTYGTATYIPYWAMCHSAGKIYYADCNQIHEMNEDESGDRIVYSAEDVVYAILANQDGTCLYLFTDRNVYRYTIANGETVCLEIELPGEPYGFDITQDNELWIGRLKLYQPSYWEGFIYSQSDIYYMGKKITGNEEQQQSESLCSYDSEHYTYVLREERVYNDANSCDEVSWYLDRRKGSADEWQNVGTYSFRIKISHDSDDANKNYSWCGPVKYDMQGDDGGCIIKDKSGNLYYADYHAKTIELLSYELDVYEMKLYDTSHLLVHKMNGEISYISYDRTNRTMQENYELPKEAEGVFSGPECIDANENCSVDDATFIATWGYCRQGDTIIYADCNQIHRMNSDETEDHIIFSADEVVTVVELTEDGAYLYFKTTGHVYRLSMDSLECRQVCELPKARTGMELIDSDMIRISQLELRYQGDGEGFCYVCADSSEYTVK